MLGGLCLAFTFPANAPAQTITNQPQSLTVNNASTATFTVGASGATNYQWRFNTTNLSDGTKSDGVIISGSATSALTLEDVTTNEAGSYTVVVNGSVTSSNAALTITNGTIVRFILSGFIGGGTSNVDVQLFDHDKPATVENFLHYVRSGAYTNMFFDRCDPGFVLQGGDDGATNQTNTSSPITGWDIASYIATNQNLFTNPPFPAQVNNEFGFGPLIHNRFGTIAMGLNSQTTNSATSAFFFNLVDNSSDLDSQSFTVFGRIMNNSNEMAFSNVLAYFNTLSNGYGAVEPAVFLDYGVSNTIPSQNLLPVNYVGTNAPANANLVFCIFSFPQTLATNTNSPTVAITSAASPVPATNLQGTASDEVGLADVICVLIPQAAADGTYPYPYTNGSPETNYAVGTTNWSLNLYPGSYGVSVQSQNGAGYLSAPATNKTIITAIVTNGNGTISFTQGASSNANPVGYPLQNGTQYSVEATAATNQLFVNWTSGSFNTINPGVQFKMQDGLLLTATFISNAIPNSIAFIYPRSNAIISTNAFNITGTISNVPSNTVTVTCQIYSTTTYLAVSPALTNIGTNTWSVSVTTNLPVDSYVVEAIAMDSASNSTMITNNFTVATNALLQLDVVGPGTNSGATNGESILIGTTFTNTAIPNTGLFYTWSNSVNSEVSMNLVQTNIMAAGLTLTATFVSNTLPPNSITFTSPPANVVLSNGDVQVGGTISNVPSPPVTVICQIFSQTNLLAVTSALTTNGTTNWSLIMSGLGAGSYIALVKAVDQSSNSTVIRENFNAYIDTNLPAISILYPATNAILTDNNYLSVSGTASDTNGLALVSDYLFPQTAADGTTPNAGEYFFDNALGTTNWSLDFGIVPPGVYTNYAVAQDNAGNYNVSIRLLTNTAILINGNGSVSLAQGTSVKANPVGYPLQYGTAYKVVATPGAGQTFAGWSEGAYTTTNLAVTFTNSAGLLWTATFVPSNTGKGISFTYPTLNARLTTNTFLLKGRMTSSFKSARISCQIFSRTTGYGVGPLLATSGTSTWSAGVSNLPPDNYVVIAAATNAAGQSAIISEQFSVVALAEVAGTYTGLFICTNSPVAPTNSGFLTFTVEPSGSFSGRLIFPPYRAIPIYSLPFENIYFTTGIYSISASENVPEKPLSLVIYLDLNGGSDIAVGTIFSGAWSSQLICHRAVTKLSTNTIPATGKYILSLQPGNQTNGPDTNGYATLVISSGGTMALSGVLPDDTTFSQSARVSKDGIWPLFAIPAGDKNNGMLIGWETNSASGSCSGQLYWYKAPNVGAYYTNGVDTNVNSTGTHYTPPAEGSYSIVFQGGTMSEPVTNDLAMTRTNGQFKPVNPTDKLAISLSANGVLTGHFVGANDNKPLQFKGAFLGQSQGGSGFILEDDGQTGYFLLEPQ